MLVLATLLAVCLPLSCALSIARLQPTPLPLIIWHGLGDKFDNPALHDVGTLANATHPGTYVYYIRLDDDPGNDRTATFFGNLTAQIQQVCLALGDDPHLYDPKTKRMRVDALGFSQAGQFLRGLVEQCPALSVRSLVTFGSQHNGIAEAKPCDTWDLVCRGAIGLLRGNIWSDTVQGRVVPAQYFRTVDPDTNLASPEYIEHSAWLADLNNEREKKNELYATRLSLLEKFVMFVFVDDQTVVPKESGWFAEINSTSQQVIPLQERSLYKEDWLGLKKLDEKGGLVFKPHPGDHMQLEEGILNKTFETYFGPERSKSLVVSKSGSWCASDRAQATIPPRYRTVWARIMSFWDLPGQSQPKQFL